MPQPNQVGESTGRESYWSLMLAALRYRNFRLVWLGSLSEHFGEFMEITTILWLAKQMTDDPFMLTFVGAARYMAMILFPIVGGVIADRVDRRGLLITALLVSALLSLLLATLAFTGIIVIWHLVAIGLFGGIAMSFNHPARQTIVPNLVRKEHLLNAISLDYISVYASRIGGALLAGYLMVFLGAWPIFVFRALGCFLAVFWLLLARVPPTPPATRREAPWQNLVEGFHYLRTNTVVLILVVLYLIPWLAGQTLTSFLPVFAIDILHRGEVGYGLLQSAPGLGAIFALIGLTMLTYYQRKSLLLVASGTIMGIGLIGFSASTGWELSLALIVIASAMQTVLTTLITTTIQGVVPDKMRGRVMSWREVAFGLGPSGGLLFGLIARYTGVPISLGLLGAVCLVVSLLVITLLPRLRSIE